MRQVVEGYPHDIVDISILSITADDTNWSIGVRIEGPDGLEQRNVHLTNDYRILQADIADIELAGHAAAPARPSSTPQPSALADPVSIPFSIQKGLIVVQAELNGVAGNFLVDTGAQAMIANTVHFSTEQLPTVALDHAMPSGVGGALSGVRSTRDLDLAWGNLHVDIPRALAIDLSHLEASLEIPIVGLIGFDVLERFEIYFDYTAGILSLYRLDNDHKPIGAEYQDSQAAVVRFDMIGHLPVFPVEIGGRVVKLGLDSGAAEAMLFKKWETPMAGEYEFLRIAEMRGADKAVRTGSEVKFDTMRVSGIDYDNVIFRFNDIVVAGGDSLKIDGLLGYQFLSSRPTSINFRARELKIW
jgi:hypothetical protein